MKKVSGLFFAFLLSMMLMVSCHSKNDDKYSIIYSDRDEDGMFFEVYLEDFSLEVGERVSKEILSQFESSEIKSYVFDFWNKKFSADEMKRSLDENVLSEDKWEPPTGTQTFMINYWPLAKEKPNWKIGQIFTY